MVQSALSDMQGRGQEQESEAGLVRDMPLGRHPQGGKGEDGERGGGLKGVRGVGGFREGEQGVDAKRIGVGGQAQYRGREV